MNYKKEMEEIMSLINNAHDMLNKVITGLGRKESDLVYILLDLTRKRISRTSLRVIVTN